MNNHPARVLPTVDRPRVLPVFDAPPAARSSWAAPVVVLLVCLALVGAFLLGSAYAREAAAANTGAECILHATPAAPCNLDRFAH